MFIIGQNSRPGKRGTGQLDHWITDLIPQSNCTEIKILKLKICLDLGKMDRNWSAMLYLVINFLSAKTKTTFGGGCWSSMEIFCAFISFIRSTIVWTKHKQWPVASEWEVLGASANTKEASTNGMRVQILSGSSSSSSCNLQVHVIRDYMSFILSPFQPRATNRTKEAYDWLC